MSRKVLFVCGGTGGHIYPALAIADSMKRAGEAHIVFAGRKGSMEEKLVSPYWHFEHIKAVPLARGKMVQNLLLPFKLTASLWSAQKVIRRIKPAFVVATGGYVSLPVILVAGISGIPVYIQEQNAVAGVANKIGSLFAKKVFVTSEEAAKAFPKGKGSIQGNPVRALPEPGSLPVPEEFENAAYRILILGGSQGGRGINQKMADSLDRIAKRPDVTVVWQAGPKNVDDINKKYSIPPNVHVAGFLNPVYAYIDCATLIVSRAGASTLAELLAFGKASILFPFPFATANHQEFNARVVEKAGAAMVELDEEPNHLWDKVESLLDNPELLTNMSKKAKELGVPDAADRIVSQIFIEEPV